MVHTQSDMTIPPVAVERRGSLSDVWLRRNIRQVDVDGQTMWEADEVCGTLSGGMTVERAQSMFDRLWDEFDPPEEPTEIEIVSDALAELSEVASDLAETESVNADAIAELSALVSEIINGGGE